MLTLLSVYSESARQDFLLPAAENVTLCARAERFGLGRDIALTLSAAGGWHFTGPCTASLRHAGVPYADQPLKAGDSLAYYLSGRVALVLLVRQQASPFAAYDRYRVRPGSIYIGSAADCGLQFTFSSGGQQYITQYHAELRFDGTSFGICDRSRNGVFVNGRRVRGSAALAFGDEVDIWGLSLVILNGGLAVRRTPGLTVASGVLTPGNQPAVPLGAALSQTVCHRAPRSLAPLVAAPITPEAALPGDAGFLSARLSGPPRRAADRPHRLAGSGDRAVARPLRRQHPRDARAVPLGRALPSRRAGRAASVAAQPRPGRLFDLPRRAGGRALWGRTGPARRRPRRAIQTAKKIRCAA